MINNMKVLYITSSCDIGPLNYLRRYLKETGLAKLFIAQVPPVRLAKERFHIDAFTVDASGSKKSHQVTLARRLPAIVVYLLHYLASAWILSKVFWELRREAFDICFAEPCFNAAFGYLLKRMGRVRLFVFVNGDIVSDHKAAESPYFLPRTPSSPFRRLAKVIDILLLKVQLRLRRLGYRADLVWYVSDKIKQWDNSHGLVAKHDLVARVVFVDQEQSLEKMSVPKAPFSLGYIGRLDEDAGLGMILSCVKIIRERLPEVRAHLVGGSGPAVDYYRKMAQDKGILENVTFYGFVPEQDDAFDIISHTRLGLALYKPVANNVSLYTEPAKVKDYINVGMPVVITKNGPAVAEEVGRFGAGILVDYQERAIADAIIEVLSSPQRYASLQEGVRAYAQYSDYRQGIKQAWDRILEEYDKSGVGV